MKKYLLLLLILLIALSPIIAQNFNKDFIDSIVEKDNSIDKKFKKSFSVKRNSDSKKNTTENWEYIKQKKLLYFSIKYRVDSTKYSEEYYLYNNKLIFSNEREISFFPSNGSDSYSVWGGDYYFSKDKMIHYETLGHGKSESENWDPEKETIKRYFVRRKQLKSHTNL